MCDPRRSSASARLVGVKAHDVELAHILHDEVLFFVGILKHELAAAGVPASSPSIQTSARLGVLEICSSP